MHRSLESYWSEAKAYYKTDHWRRLSTECKERDHYTCRKCGKQAKTREERRAMHAHHVITRRPVPYPTALDVLSNLETQCDKCHTTEHPHMQYLQAKPRMFRAARPRRKQLW